MRQYFDLIVVSLLNLTPAARFCTVRRSFVYSNILYSSCNLIPSYFSVYSICTFQKYLYHALLLYTPILLLTPSPKPKYYTTSIYSSLTSYTYSSSISHLWIIMWWILMTRNMNNKSKNTTIQILYCLKKEEKDQYTEASFILIIYYCIIYTILPKWWLPNFLLVLVLLFLLHALIWMERYFLPFLILLYAS